MIKLSQLKMDQYDINPKPPDVRAKKRKFAVYIKEGRSMYGKFPLDLPTDLRDSIKALRETQDSLPDEIVKVAKHYINMESLSVHGVEAFSERIEEPRSAVVRQMDIDWTRFSEKLAARHPKTASYALFVDGEGRYEITTQVLLKKAMQWFEKNRTKLSGAHRREFARNVIKRAEELEVEPTQTIKKASSAQFDSNAESLIKLRASYLFGDNWKQLQKEYYKLAHSINVGNVDPEIAFHKLSSLDKEAPRSLFKFIPDAYDTIFGFPETKKEASIDLESIKEHLTSNTRLEDLEEWEKEALSRVIRDGN